MEAIRNVSTCEVQGGFSVPAYESPILLLQTKPAGGSCFSNIYENYHSLLGNF
jgi:hypothetical protein